MAVFSNGGSTSPDIYIGVLCILTTIVCSLLNLVVFKHVSGKKKSLASCLYLTLSVADFLTGWVITITYGISALEEKVEECRNSTESSCNEDYFKRLLEPTLEQRLHSILCWIVCVAPSNITAFLAMSRFYQIKYPLQRISIKRVMLTLLLSLTPIPVVVGCAMLDINEAENSIPYRLPATNQAWNFHPSIFGLLIDSMSFYLLIIAGTWVLEVAAISTSILTIYEIVKRRLMPVSDNRKGQKTKKTLKILITNGGNVVILVIMTIVAFNVRKDVEDISRKDGIWYLMINTIIPSLISTVNPIIYITMTPKFTYKNIVRPLKCFIYD